MGEIKLAANCITAIDGIINDVDKLIVYPQPAKDVLFIKKDLSKTFSYRIFDCTGRNVQEGSCENHSISVNSLNSGLYFLVVGGCSATKFVVEKE